MKNYFIINPVAGQGKAIEIVERQIEIVSDDLKKDNDLDKLKKEGKYKIDLVVSDAVGNKTNVTVDITSSSFLTKGATT